MRSEASSNASSSRPTWCRPISSAPRIYNQRTGEFTTSLGPVFTNLLLADEINRAPAKVQSALLEVMQERQVTIGRDTHRAAGPLPRHGHPEPDRVGGHLPAARGAGRPVHAQGPRVVPVGDGGVRHRRAHDRHDGTGARGVDHRPAARVPTRRGVGVRRSVAHGVRGAARAGDARTAPQRARRDRAVRALRRQSAARRSTWRCRHGRARSSTGATTHCPTTSATSRST